MHDVIHKKNDTPVDPPDRSPKVSRALYTITPFILGILIDIIYIYSLFIHDVIQQNKNDTSSQSQLDRSRWLARCHGIRRRTRIRRRPSCSRDASNDRSYVFISVVFHSMSYGTSTDDARETTHRFHHHRPRHRDE